MPYDATALTDFAAALFRRAGMEDDKAHACAQILVEGDLLGHTTHGLALLPQYLDAIEAGDMRGTGEPAIVAEAPAAQTWDGKRIAGPWLTLRATRLAADRARETGIYCITIARSAHIGCLAAYLPAIVAGGQMLILTCSDPSVASVAPFGGTRRLFTPNPLAAGWPTPDGGAILDVSMSITTNGMTARKRAEGARFDQKALLDASGAPTDDPNALFTEPPGSLLPLGGADSGHKGYALALMVEALTSALAGHGRADAPKEWGASVTVIALDPARFAGLDAFTRETGWIEQAVHENPPIGGGAPPRLPGARALALRARQIAEGVTLHPSIPPLLTQRGDRVGIALPLAHG